MQSVGKDSAQPYITYSHHNVLKLGQSVGKDAHTRGLCPISVVCQVACPSRVPPTEPGSLPNHTSHCVTFAPLKWSRIKTSGCYRESFGTASMEV